MAIKTIKGIIRVGKSSNLKFNNTVLYRAITMNDVIEFLNCHKDISFIVMEDSASSNLDIIPDFEVPVYWYNPKFEIENEHKAFFDIKELQDEISNDFNINVRTYYYVETSVDMFKNTTDWNSGYEEESNEDEDLDSGIIEVLDDEEQGSTDEDEETVYVEDKAANKAVDLTEDDYTITRSTDVMEDTLEYKEEHHRVNKDSIDKDKIIKELQDKLNKAVQDVEDTQNKLGENTVKLFDLIEVNKSVEEQLNFYTALLKDLDKTDEIRELDAEAEQDDSVTLEKHNEAVGALSVKNQELSDKISELQLYIANLELERDAINSEKLALELDLQDLRADNLVKTKSNDELEKLKETLEIKIDELNNALEISKNDSEVTAKLEQEKGKLIDESNALEQTIVSLKSYVKELEAEIEQSKSKMASYEISVQNLNDKVRSLNDEINQLSRTVQTKDEQITFFTEQKDNLDNQIKTLKLGKERIEHKNKKLGIENQNSLNDIKKLNLRLDELTNEINNKNISIEMELVDKLREKIVDLERNNLQYEEELNEERTRSGKLTLRIEEITQRGSVDSSGLASERVKEFRCKYSAKAKIIPVFGNGSYGTTTVALSIGRELSGNNLYIDLDLSSPLLPDWVRGTNPFISNFKNITTRSSVMNVAAVKGVDFIINNRELAIQRISTNRKTKSALDYISGVYGRCDGDLYEVDFNKLINTLGNMYDNIIVDLGQMCCNDTTDKLIKMFSDISHKSIVVGLHNSMDIRLMWSNVKSLSVNVTKCIWVFNMAKTTVIDDFTKKITTNNEYVIIIRESKLYGEYRTFESVAILKQKVLELINKLNKLGE